MDAPRPTSELAADIAAGIEANLDGAQARAKARLAHEALVARITDLEAQVEYTDRALTNMTEWHNEAMARLKAAEAQVAALTQERNRLDHLHKLDHSPADQWSARAEAAEAALATTRQALEVAANAVEQAELLLLRERFDDDPEAKVVRAVLRSARRALAATEEPA